MKKIFLFIFWVLPIRLMSQEVVQETYPFDSPVLVIRENFKKESIGRYLSVLECLGKPSLAKIMRDSINHPFKQNYTDIFSRTPTQHETAYWLSFKIKNETSSDLQLILEADQPLLNEIEFFEIRNQERFSNHNATGNRFEFNTRQIPFRNFLFRLHLLPSEEKHYYLYIHHQDRKIYLPLQVYHPETFALHTYQQQTGIGMLIGVGVLFLAVSLFFYFHLGSLVFLFYSVYVLSAVFLIISNNGLAFQYLWSHKPIWSEYAGYLFGYVGIWALLRMYKAFLKEQKILPFLPNILQTFASSTITLTMFCLILIYFETRFIFYLTGELLYNLEMLLIFWGVSMMTFYMLRKPNSTVYWIIFLHFIGLIPMYFYYLDWAKFPQNLYAHFFLLYGVAWTFSFFFFALIYPIRFFKNDDELQKLISVNTFKAITEQKEFTME